MSDQESTDLDKAMVQGFAWTAGLKWGAQILSWAATLIVARILTPEDYGLIGMAAVYFGLARMMSDVGLGTAVVTQQDLTEEQIAETNSLCVLLGVAAFLISCLASIPLATFFREPDLRWVVVVMSVSFLMSGFQTVPKALLQRDLKFRLLGIIEGLQITLQSGSMVVLAILGLGYWTLVLGAVIGAFVATGLLLVKGRHSFERPSYSSLKSELSFGWHVLMTRLSWYVISNSDFLIAGRVLGRASLGAYSIAWTLATIPLERINEIVSRVTYPVFSAVQKDRAALRRYLLVLTEGLSFLIWPLACGLALVANEFVLVVLGQKWEAAITPLRILALSTTFRAVLPVIALIPFVIGGARLAMYVGFVTALIMPSAFYIFSRWGTDGIATAWLVVYPLTSLFMIGWVFKKIEVAPSRYFNAIWPALSSTLLMSGAVIAARAMLPPTWSLASKLALEVLTGAVTYFAAAALHWKRLSHLRTVLVRTFRK